MLIQCTPIVNTMGSTIEGKKGKEWWSENEDAGGFEAYNT